MKHKHYDMIVAKAENMDLVVFSKNDSGWRWSDFADIVCWHEHEHFLCLPQHKEACLHWLNGGEVQQSPDDESFWLASADVNKVKWMPWTSFMKEGLIFRIKPKKEKRWIGVRNDSVTALNFHCKDDAMFWVDHNADANSDYWQFIEIEIEV